MRGSTVHHMSECMCGADVQRRHTCVRACYSKVSWPFVMAVCPLKSPSCPCDIC